MAISGNSFAPEAAGAIRHWVARFTRSRRTDQSTDEYFVESDLLRRRAESKRGVGAGSPEQLASVLCMGKGALSRHEKSLVTASCHRCPRFEDGSANLRRLFGPRGRGGRQGALLTEEAARPRQSTGDIDFSAAYRKARKQGTGKKKKEGPPKRGGGKVNGSGQTLNGFNRKTDLRYRRFRCDSEYHLAPRRPWRDAPRGEARPLPPGHVRPQRPSRSCIQWRPLFCPNKRRARLKVRREANANSPLSPRRMWGKRIWPRKRIVWR